MCSCSDKVKKRNLLSVNNLFVFAKTMCMEKIHNVKKAGSGEKETVDKVRKKATSSKTFGKSGSTKSVAKKMAVVGVSMALVSAMAVGGPIFYGQGEGFVVNARKLDKKDAVSVMGVVSSLSFDAMYGDSFYGEALRGDSSYAQEFAAVSGDIVDGLGITSKAAFLMEANSGKVLYQKDSDRQLPIASMVKIMTLAVIYDALEAGEITLDQMVPVSEASSGMGGSQAFLDAGSEYSVDDLIKTIIIASANDSCVAMAEIIAGSESEFVNRMNTLAEKLGMKNTNFVNVTGLPAVGAYSTAEDIAKVYAYMMKSQYYGTHEKVWMYDLTHPGGRVTGLTNTNRHARFYNGVTGGKTGFTSEAGHCITVSATRGDLRPVAVIIGASDSKTRFAESGKLMDHVFANWQNKMIVSVDDVMATVKVKGAAVDKIDVFARENLFDLVKKGEKGEPEVKIEVEKTIKAGFKAGDAIGKVFVTKNGKVVQEVDLVAKVDVKKIGYWGAIRKIAGKYKLS